MNDNQNYSDYLNNLSSMAQQQDKGRLRSLVLNYHSSLQRLPALKQEMDLLLQSNDAIDYDDLIKRIEPVLQQASDWLFEVDKLPKDLTQDAQLQQSLQMTLTGLTLSNSAKSIHYFYSLKQKIIDDKATEKRREETAKREAEEKRQHEQKRQALREANETALKPLLVTFHDTLQQLPVLKQTLNKLLLSNENYDVKQDIEPALQQASDWLLKMTLLPVTDLAVDDRFKVCIEQFSNVLHQSGIKQLASDIARQQQIMQRLAEGKFICQDGIATGRKKPLMCRKKPLMWLRFAHGQQWRAGAVFGEAIKVTWSKAFEVAKQFNDQGGYGGFTDWRLPSITELKTLIDKNRGKSYNCIDVEVFPNNGTWFWSSSPYDRHGSNAWVVNFNNGSDDDGNRGNSYFVRLVRAGQ